MLVEGEGGCGELLGVITLILPASVDSEMPTSRTDSCVVRRVGIHSTLANTVDASFGISAKLNNLEVPPPRSAAFFVAQPLILRRTSGIPPWRVTNQCRTTTSARGHRNRPRKRPKLPRMNHNPRLSRIHLRNLIRLLTLCGAMRQDGFSESGT